MHNLHNKVCLGELTAGDDQLPHESANVTKGSGHSNPNMPRIVTSSLLDPLGKTF